MLRTAPHQAQGAKAITWAAAAWSRGLGRWQGAPEGWGPDASVRRHATSAAAGLSSSDEGSAEAPPPPPTGPLVGFKVLDCGQVVAGGCWEADALSW